MTSARERVTKTTDAALPTVRLTRRVGRLQEGVRENALLAERLEEVVAGIEQSLVPVLEAAHPVPPVLPEDVADDGEAR